MEIMISILVCLYMFVNGILIGGCLGLALYGIGILITKLWELIKSL